MTLHEVRNDETRLIEDTTPYSHITKMAARFHKEYKQTTGKSPERMEIAFNLPAHPTVRYIVKF